LRGDYANMREMFFSESPDFDRMIGLLQDWESEFNDA
jgi:hypothetical protein